MAKVYLGCGAAGFGAVSQDSHMTAIEVEVRLRIPRGKAAAAPEWNGPPIDHGAVRFTKLIKVAAIPKPGAILQLAIGSGRTLTCEVTRADWNEDRAIFVLSCKYAKRMIPADECAALYNDGEWLVKPLC